MNIPDDSILRVLLCGWLFLAGCAIATCEQGWMIAWQVAAIAVAYRMMTTGKR